MSEKLAGFVGIFRDHEILRIKRWLCGGLRRFPHLRQLCVRVALQLGIFLRLQDILDRFCDQYDFAPKLALVFLNEFVDVGLVLFVVPEFGF
jgi:hypothetical protein